jgi:uncharacterized protein YyaL (SSP411 family)
MTSRLCRVALAVAACAGLSACESADQTQGPPPATTNQSAATATAPTATTPAATAPAGELLGDAPPESAPKHTNRLAKEKSPYLLQHAHNPVDWYPWGEEAFAKAKKENKPIFLSVGYSTCHWCHEMEREAFSDPEIAKVLNEHFVPVKVDREERPDVDRTYMTYVNLLTRGGGGWPMTVFLTPDREPFYGGTYFPVDDTPRQRGLSGLLADVVKLWTTDPKRVMENAADTAQKLKHVVTIETDPAAAVEIALLGRAYDNYAKEFDLKYGGFRKAPKFPTPVELNFLLHYFNRSGEAKARDMVTKTLRSMAAGGIRDHLGGGFHRYSTDERWFLPHFEKMLYDQAQIASAYLDAYQVTGDQAYADVARETFEYVLRDLTSPEGAFYSAEDADSVVDPAKPEEKAEGAFYVWRMAEIRDILGKEAAEVFAFHYGVTEDGNVARDADPHNEFTGKNVLYAAHGIEETAEKFGKPPAEIAAALAESRRQLLAARAKRPHPYMDDKTIVAWNGLMISALARGGPILKEPRYTAAAVKAATFIRDKLHHPETHELTRIFRKGPADVPGFLDDYAFYVESLIDLYETTLDVQWLKLALDIQVAQDRIFADAEGGGYFNSRAGDANLIVRMKDDNDGVEPSGNSVAARNLLRLAHMTEDKAMKERAEKTIQLYAKLLQQAPSAMPRMLVAIDLHLDEKPKQIVLAGDPAKEDFRRMHELVFQRYVPNRIILGADGGPGQAFLSQRLTFMKDMGPKGGKATAYICENQVCDLPTNDLAVLEEQLTAANAETPAQTR